jgi:hypothetical protein
MVVKCIINKSDSLDHSSINSNLSEFISVGSEFIVFGISVDKANTYFIIFDEEHLLHVPMSFFEIIDSSVPQFWVVKPNQTGGFMLGPELFFQEFFFDEFSDRDPELRRKFQKIQVQST